MKNIGYMLAFLGACGLIYVLSMDVSASSPFGRIANIELLDRRRMYLYISLAVLVSGVALFIASNFTGNSYIEKSHSVELETKINSEYVTNNEINLVSVLKLAKSLKSQSKSTNPIGIVSENKAMLDNIKSVMPDNLADEFERSLLDFMA